MGDSNKSDILRERSLTGGFADVKAYLLADAQAHFPELTGKLLIGDIGAKKSKIEDVAISNVLITGLNGTATDSDKKLISSYVQENSPHLQSGLISESGRNSKSFVVPYPEGLSQKSRVGQAGAYLLVLNRPDCLPCTYEGNEPQCPDQVFPDKARFNQLRHFFLQHHEMAHLAAPAMGLHPPDYPNTPVGLQQLEHFMERRSDAYAAIRTIQNFGQEGVEFVKAFEKYRVFEAVTSASHEHNSSAILAALTQPEMLKRIRQLSPREALLKAHELAQNPAHETPQLFADIIAGGPRAEAAQKRFSQLAGNIGERTEAQMAETYKLNPLRAASQRTYNGQIISVDQIDFSQPDQIENLDQLRKKLLPHMCQTPKTIKPETLNPHPAPSTKPS